jgi:predicted RNA-binding protein with PUA-like domain
MAAKKPSPMPAKKKAPRKHAGTKPPPKPIAKSSAKPVAKPGSAPAPIAGGRRYWLLKTEPTSFSFDDLWSSKNRRTAWSGVRNHQARNFLRDTMQPADLVLVYHSSAEPPGVAGIARIAGRARPDPTQFDPTDEHCDPAAMRDNPTWYEIDVEALAKLARFVSLEALKADARLARMLVVQRGQRLSVQPVQEGEWRAVVGMAGLDPDDFG